jgi:hypothetical protein
MTIHEQTAALSVLCTLFHSGFQYHRFHGDTAIGCADIQCDCLQGHRLAANSGIMDYCLHQSQQVSWANPGWAPQTKD